MLNQRFSLDMLKITFTLLAILVVQSCSVDEFRAEQTDLREFDSSCIKKLILENFNGYIKVRTITEPKIIFNSSRWAIGNSEEDAQYNLTKITFSYVREDLLGLLKIEADVLSPDPKKFGCNMSIELPADVSQELSTKNGFIEVSGARSDVRCFTTSGNVTVMNCIGNFTVQTLSGHVSIVNHNGNIIAGTSNGKIDADVTLPSSGRCELVSANGGVKLSIPYDTSAKIDIETQNGQIEIRDLTIDIKIQKENMLSAIIGRGEGSIKIQTRNGDVMVTKK